MRERPIIAVAWPKPDYLAALEQADADARLLDPGADELSFALDGCDGVLLTGGVDVDPARYHSERHPTVEVNRKRDDYEFSLAQLALDRSLPLLAICRGAQLLNVVAGGTLVQDIPSERPTPVTHSIPRPADQIAHEVSIVRGTRLAGLLTLPTDHRMAVNSRHHQSIRDLAPGFRVSATAPDGIVEAVERIEGAFCIGVQWHPENFWRTGEFSGLFAGFVAAARDVRSSRVQ